MSAPVDVLAGAIRVTRTEYSTGITTTIHEAVTGQPAGTYWIISDSDRAAVAELIAADREYDEATRAKHHEPGSAGSAKRVIAARERRRAALAACGVKP